MKKFTYLKKSAFMKALKIMLSVFLLILTTASVNAQNCSTSTNNSLFTVKKCASVNQVPFGGGSVTYTYTVTNTSGSTLYWKSISDDKISNLSYNGEIPSTSSPNGTFQIYRVLPNQSMSWTKTQSITQQTTNTVTVEMYQTLTTYQKKHCYPLDLLCLFPYYTTEDKLEGIITASTSVTVTLQPPSGNNATNCNTLWYSTDIENGVHRGTIGTVNVGGVATERFVISSSSGTNSSTLRGAAAVAVNPLNPQEVYYVPRYDNSSNTTYGGLYRYNTNTNNSQLLASNAATPNVNRLGVDANGIVWTVEADGTLWSFNPTSNTWTDRGTVSLPGRSWTTVSSGDLAFDGNGTMYLIMGDANNNSDSYLYTITPSELAGNNGANATLVGKMVTSGGSAFRFNGIAFTEDGTLYATATDGNNYSFLYRVNILTGQSTLINQISPNTAYITDLGSCALPQPVLDVTKTVDPSGFVKAGQVLTYTLSVCNEGTLVSTNTFIKEAVPAGTSYIAGSTTLNGASVSDATSGLFTTTGMKINSPSSPVTAGVIAPGQCAVITFKVVVTAASGTICNQATVSYTGGADILSDNPELPGGSDFTCNSVTPTYNISGSLYVDPNGMPIVDGTLYPNGTNVSLLDGNGNVIAQTTTNASGFYEFTGLLNGNYTVVITTPQGYVNTSSTDMATPLDGSTPVVINSANVTNVNFGIVPPLPPTNCTNNYVIGSTTGTDNLTTATNLCSGASDVTLTFSLSVGSSANNTGTLTVSLGGTQLATLSHRRYACGFLNTQTCYELTAVGNNGYVITPASGNTNNPTTGTFTITIPNYTGAANPSLIFSEGASNASNHTWNISSASITVSTPASTDPTVKAVNLTCNQTTTNLNLLLPAGTDASKVKWYSAVNGYPAASDAVYATPTTAVPGSYYYRIFNCNCLSSSSSLVKVNAGQCPSLSGTIHNDVDALTDNLVDGTGIGSITKPDATTQQLYVTLVGPDNTAISTIPVNANGTYTFENVTPHTTYSVVLGTSPTGATTSPFNGTGTQGWYATGEDITNAGPAFSDGTVNGILTGIAVGTTSVTNNDLGIQQPPTAVTGTTPSQVNPGGTTSVTVPSSYFDGNDQNGGTVTGLTITQFPTNATSFTVDNTTYYPAGTTLPSGCPTTTCANFPTTTGVPLTVDANGTTTNTIKVDPVDGTVSPVFTYTSTDNGGATSTPATVTVPFTTVNVSGNVFNDPNAGNVNNSTGTTNAVPAGMYANLVDASGIVVATATVGTDGTYSFDGVNGGNYTVVAGITQGTVGSPAPAEQWPTGWINTGDFNGTPNTGNTNTTPNVSSSFTVNTADVTNINFAMQQPPTPGTNTQPSQVNPGGTTSVTAPASAFSGTDQSNGTISSLVITTFPTNATSITINGTTYTSSTFPVGGVTVPTNATGQPTQTISVDPVDGTVTVRIPYNTIDNGGATSTTTGWVDLPFTTVSVSGNVFNDPNAGNVNNSTGTTNAVPSGMYANLVDATSGIVVATTIVGNDGTYSFNGVNGGTYTVVAGTTQGTVGSPAPTEQWPTGWINTGDFNGAPNTGNTNTTPNVSSSFPVNTADVSNINFAIQQPPIAATNIDNSRQNPGGTISSPVTTTLFDGDDVSPGTVTNLTITQFPTNATSITVGTVTYYPVGTTLPTVCALAGTCQIFPTTTGINVPVNSNGQPSITTPISVDPVDGAVSVVITYTSTDNGGATSDPATVTVPFTLPLGSISGQAWVDADNDGIQDTEEVVRAGVQVTLINTVTQQPVGSPVLTDAEGNYSFTNLPAGSYTVSFGTVPQSGDTTFTRAQNNVTAPLASNSDAVITTGNTLPIVLTPGQNVTDIDAGYVPHLPISISGHLYYDRNGPMDGYVNGNFNIPSGISAVLVIQKVDGTWVVDRVAGIPGAGQPGVGNYSFAAQSNTTYYVYNTTQPPAVGSTVVVPVSVYPLPFGATGENISDPTIGNPQGDDTVPNGVTASFTTRSGDVINVDFGIRRMIGFQVE